MFEDENYVPEYDPAEFFGRASPDRPFRIVMWFVVIVFAVVFARLADLQIVKGARNFFLAEGNRVREIPVTAPRGVLLDRNNEPLVTNVVRYSLALIPADLPRDQGTREQTLSHVANAVHLDRFKLEQRLNEVSRASFDPVVVADNLGRVDALGFEVEFNELAGVVIQKNPTREYPAANFSHLIGTIGKISKEELAELSDYRITDWIGKSGLELIYESEVRGKHGGTQVEVNAKGSIVRLIGQVRPQRGQDIALTIDKRLQEVGMQALARVATKGGALVALNPKTGEILAIGSYPEFDPNALISGDEQYISKVFSDPRRPLINRAVAAAFPSGSSIKPVWATAALAEGTISATTKLDTSSGAIRIGDFTFDDWRTHGVADVKQAIAESNNIFFYAVAGGYQQIKGLGPDRMHEWAKRFGLGSKTGVALPGEVSGFVPSVDWKRKTTGERWYVGDSYNLGIGQGNLLVSPLQLGRAIGGIATGKLAKPYLLEDTKPDEKELGIDSRVLAVVRDGMRQAVVSGSGRQLADLKDNSGSPVEAAAKTGTAQAGKGDKTHGWMVAFAPYQDPEIVVLGFVEEGGEGHATAGPVVKAMLQEWFGR